MADISFSSEESPEREGLSRAGLLSTVLTQSLLLQGLSKGCSLLQATSTCSHMGSSISCSVEICSNMVHHRGTSSPAPGAPPHPLSSLTLVSAGLFSLSVSPSSLPAIPSCHFQPHSLNSSHRCTNSITHWLSLASSMSLLEPAGSGSSLRRGSFWTLLTDTSPAAAPCYKTLSM